ncbi:MAG: zinc-binding dehydrogenase [Noviherbaspirillum sp.]
MSKQLVQQVCVHTYGAASLMQSEYGELPAPAVGEVRLRHEAIGVNHVDIYHRTGLYPLPSLPAVIGVEGAMLRGMTAHMLLAHVRPLGAGESVLVHAAAGGLGLVLVQWAKALGAKVIGTVGSRPKAELALAHGLDRAVPYREEDFVAATKEFTGGEGVHYAIDGIGGETLLRTLETVRPYGMAASIGQVAGDIAAIEPAALGPYRSIALSRPGVFRFMADLRRYREGAQATLERLAAGMQVRIDSAFPLTDGARAHALLASGKTSGSILLRP